MANLTILWRMTQMNDELNEMEEVKKACDRYGFLYHETVNGVFIRTASMAGWLILMEDEHPQLYHENYRYKHGGGNGVMGKYHRHSDVKETTAAGMVNYIYAHDKSMLKVKKKDSLGQLTY